jgi:hypothetical protein
MDSFYLDGIGITTIRYKESRLCASGTEIPDMGPDDAFCDLPSQIDTMYLMVKACLPTGNSLATRGGGR